MSNLRAVGTWVKMGAYDIRGRYRRTLLGPLWVVITTGVLIFCLGFIYGELFGQNVRDFLPYVCLGIVVWQFISASIIEGVSFFLSYKYILLGLKVTPWLMCTRLISKNFLILMHCSLLYIILMVIFDIEIALSATWAILGLFLLTLSLFSLAVTLAYLGARFGDLPPLVNALMSMMLLASPILWKPEMLGARQQWAELNPITHYIALVRDPLLGAYELDLNSLMLVSALTAFCVFIAALTNKIYRKNIVLWL